MARSNLQSLLSLLDDPNEDIAVTVMGELLKNETELMSMLGELQESENKLLRKRVQQLETIIMLRNRRRDFLNKINSDTIDIADALVELHLLYLDRDVPEMLRSMLDMFASIVGNNNIGNIDELGEFMARNKFTLPLPEEVLGPENYCIGIILEDRVGADIMLCMLAVIAGVQSNLRVNLVRLDGKFVVSTPEGRFISPENDWMPEQITDQMVDLKWNCPACVLKYASLMLFLHAVSSDNFRSIYTIAMAVCGGDDDFFTDFLPYPYNGKNPENH